MLDRHGLLVALISVAALGGAPASAATAFTCPDMTAAAVPGADPSLNDLYAGADDATAGNRLAEVTADLRNSGLRPALIVDRLVAGYCALVAADSTLSDKQKTDRVRRFALQATGLAYVPPDRGEEDVLVQTSVEPSLLSRIDQAASRAGLSRDAWIARAIERQLAQP